MRITYLTIAMVTASLLGLAACLPLSGTGNRFKAADYARGAEKVAACVATKCARLNLDSAPLRDFSVLNDMPHVTALMISYTNFDDLADIAGMSQLTELHISNTRVSDFSGLDAFPSLTVLHAVHIKGTPDPSAVAGLTNLEELVVEGRAGDDLANLGPLQNLKTLRIDSSSISDLSVLPTLKRLEVFTTYAVLPDDTGPILEIKRLKQLMLRNVYLTPEFEKALKQKGGAVFIYEPVIVC